MSRKSNRNNPKKEIVTLKPKVSHREILGINDTYWNGERVPARRVKVVVGKARTGWWCAGMDGQIVDAVQINYHGLVFYIFNQNAEGWWKVTEGRGLPQYGHKSLPDDSVVYTPPVKT